MLVLMEVNFKITIQTTQRYCYRNMIRKIMVHTCIHNHQLYYSYQLCNTITLQCCFACIVKLTNSCACLPL